MARKRKKPKKDAFQRCLEQASDIVKTWPKWAQDCLEDATHKGNSYDPHDRHLYSQWP